MVKSAQNSKNNPTAEPTLGDEAMKKAYKAASSINLKKMERENPEDLKYIKAVKESDVVIVTGQYDHGQVVFELCGMPYSLVSPDDVPGLDLRDDQILFVNCPGNIESRGLERIKSFVINGGMLVTTDWSLKNVLEQIFPEIAKYNGKATADDHVRIVFEKVDDTFLKGLLDPKDEPIWWLEGSSYPIQILSPEKVKILVSSKEMQEKYGESPIVIAFESGKGKIYHLTSHFYLQRSESRSKRQLMTGVSYMKEKGLSSSDFSESEMAGISEANLGATEAAYTSVKSVTNMVLEQKKRVEKRKDEQAKSAD